MDELAGLAADLPGPGPRTAKKTASPVVPGDADRCLLCALLICCPPAGIAWLLRDLIRYILATAIVLVLGVAIGFRPSGGAPGVRAGTGLLLAFAPARCRGSGPLLACCCAPRRR